MRTLPRLAAVLVAGCAHAPGPVAPPPAAPAPPASVHLDVLPGWTPYRVPIHGAGLLAQVEPELGEISVWARWGPDETLTTWLTRPRGDQFRWTVLADEPWPAAGSGARRVQVRVEDLDESEAHGSDSKGNLVPLAPDPPQLTVAIGLACDPPAIVGYSGPVEVVTAAAAARLDAILAAARCVPR